VVQAARAIRVGEELTLSYIKGEGLTRAQRQAYLLENFGFACECSLCSLTGTLRERSDERQRRLAKINPVFQPILVMQRRGAN